MTREAIEYFKFHRKIICEDYLKICPKDSIAYQITLKEKAFYDMAIEALEQEPKHETVTEFADKCRECGREKVLDKIRAEIEQEIVPRNSDQYDHEAMWQNSGLRMALKAIDKYRSETEDT